ncbi:MAG: hypothetical protein RL427_1425 [Bacteroidota bacterium]|jgi:hypothetical protein
MQSKKLLFILISFFTLSLAQAQSSDDILNLLIQKGVVKQADADSVRADYAIKQQDKPKDKTLTIDLQLKNRLEARNGYASLPTETSVASAFVNQRTRLTFNYQHNNMFNSVVSLQDVRVWGMHDPRGLDGTIQLFEGYVEPLLTPSFSIRIGRQRLVYDNQRLFAENDWRVNANAHDAVNFRYNKNKLNVELAAAFNQTSERVFGTDFTPAEPSTSPASSTPAATWATYKALGVNYIKYDISPSVTATSIVAGDGYQDATIKEKIYWRFTYGGRLEYKNEHWYATASGYLQSGRNSGGKTLDAWYLQPELRYTQADNFVIRLGAEVFSGDDGTVGEVDHNFVPLYGVAHRFNGFMDLFTKFPGDLNNAGLVNPYLFITKTVSPKLEVGSYHHLYFTQQRFVDAAGEKLTKYMGYEHDLLLTYKPNAVFNIEAGLCFALPTETMIAIKKSGEPGRVPTWFYLQCRFSPRLFKSVFN